MKLTPQGSTCEKTNPGLWTLVLANDTFWHHCIDQKLKDENYTPEVENIDPEKWWDWKTRPSFLGFGLVDSGVVVWSRGFEVSRLCVFKHQLMVWIGGLGPGGLGFEAGYQSNNPFHKGILGIQTTGPQTTN